MIDAYPSAMTGAATVLLPSTCYGEAAGTFVNFAGRAQHVAKLLVPKVDCRPPVLLLGDLLEDLGAGEATPPGRIREQISAEVPEFADIEWEALPGSTGQDIAGADAAALAAPATGAFTKMLASGLASPKANGPASPKANGLAGPKN